MVMRHNNIPPEVAEKMAEDFYKGVATVRKKISGLFKKPAGSEVAEPHKPNGPAPRL